MNDKNKAIEEMAKILCKKTIDCNMCMAIDNLYSCFYQGIVKQLYNAGYRKEKETAREVLQKVDYESNGQTVAITNLIRKQYGVEV